MVKITKDSNPELFDALEARSAAIALYDNIPYRRYTDNNEVFYIQIEKKPEKDSIGIKNSLHQGYYPPNIPDKY